MILPRPVKLLITPVASTGMDRWVNPNFQPGNCHTLQGSSEITRSSSSEEAQSVLTLGILLYAYQGCSCSLERGLQMLRALKSLVIFGPGALDYKPVAHQHPEFLVSSLAASVHGIEMQLYIRMKLLPCT